MGAESPSHFPKHIAELEALVERQAVIIKTMTDSHAATIEAMSENHAATIAAPDARIAALEREPSCGTWPPWPRSPASAAGPRP